MVFLEGMAIELTHQKLLNNQFVLLYKRGVAWEARFANAVYRVADLNEHVVPVGGGHTPAEALADLARQLASIPLEKTSPQPLNSLPALPAV